ncbi:MAG TPA: hypothetical protein VIE44_07175 [Methylomirabilota bacterium]
MSTKTDYSAEEWKLVLKAPLMAGLAVVAASPSGPLGVLRELFAVGKLVAETKSQAEGQGGFSNELLLALVADLSSPDGRAQLDAAELRGLATEQLRAHALDTCRTVAVLLDRKATREEADGLKRWLVAIAQRTAEAAKEGGFLGIGGTRVSETETAAIREIAQVLGVPPPA